MKNSYLCRAALAITLLLFHLGNATAAERDDVELKNPKIMERYMPRNQHDWDFGEHLMINMFVGAFTGGIFGGAVGAYAYETDDRDASQDTMVLYAAILGATGALAGGATTYFEYKRDEQFTIGRRLMNHTWYGGLGGALVGSIAGLIPYSSSKDSDDIINYAAYGTAAGLLVGWSVFFFVKPDSEAAKLRWGTYYDPFRRSFNFSVTRRY